jgi:hypothetical protein
MLTEADMIRIMKEKYSLAESIAEAYIDNEARKMLDVDELAEISGDSILIEKPAITDYQE